MYVKALSRQTSEKYGPVGKSLNKFQNKFKIDLTNGKPIIVDCDSLLLMLFNSQLMFSFCMTAFLSVTK